MARSPSENCVLRRARRLPCVVAMAACLAAGCASAPYRFGTVREDARPQGLRSESGPQIVRGTPHAVLDGVGWVFGIPDKILLWNVRMENHKISPETEEAVAEYLAKNDLDHVKVRLNQYDPADNWRRLVANKSVGWGWKYSLGTLSWLGETIIPGRIFGGDHYNPFTETIHLYSDVPAVAVHEGGHAKDFATRYYKGTYAAGYLLPITPLWYEAVATNDAVSYFRAEGRLEDELEAYRVLYPAYGTYVGNAAGNLAPGGGTPLYLLGVAGGHVAGRLQARRVQIEHETSSETVIGRRADDTDDRRLIRQTSARTTDDDAVDSDRISSLRQ